MKASKGVPEDDISDSVGETPTGTTETVALPFPRLGIRGFRSRRPFALPNRPEKLLSPSGHDHLAIRVGASLGGLDGNTRDTWSKRNLKILRSACGIMTTWP